jgi:hypothetical protein
VARRFAAQVAPRVEGAPAFDRLRVRAARAERDFGDPRVLAAWGDRGVLLEDATVGGPFRGPGAGVGGDLLAVPASLFVWSLGLSEARVVATGRGAAGVLVNLGRFLSRRVQAVGALRLDASRADGGATLSVPLVWVPCEPSHDLGLVWRPDAEAGPAFVLALTNGSLGYAVTAAEQRTQTYEALATLFGPETDALLGGALHAARAALGP